MGFLCSYIDSNEETLTNLKHSASDDESTMSAPSTSGSYTAKKKRTEKNTQDVTPTQTLFQSYLEKKYQNQTCKEVDTVVDFFTNLGQTVKTFPEDLQIRVKGMVFKIINDAEAEILKRRKEGSSE